ncbi:MAG: hypothetical protein ACI96P_000635, partial [Candidatus Azotimanducaceae bacterium]
TKKTGLPVFFLPVNFVNKTVNWARRPSIAAEITDDKAVYLYQQSD